MRVIFHYTVVIYVPFLFLYVLFVFVNFFICVSFSLKQTNKDGVIRMNVCEREREREREREKKKKKEREERTNNFF